MARIRSIKPEYFMDDELAELGPISMLLFAGLWTQADREGRLRDRPTRLKACLLPYFDCDVDALLDGLEPDFIERYEVDGERYIQIVNFLRHQCPNVKEPPSTLPVPCQHHTSTSLIGREGKERKGREREGTRTILDLNAFDSFYEALPVHRYKGAALAAFTSAVESVDADTLIEAAKSFTAAVKAGRAKPQSGRYFIEDGTWRDYIQPKKRAKCSNPDCNGGMVLLGDEAAPCPECGR